MPSPSSPSRPPKIPLVLLLAVAVTACGTRAPLIAYDRSQDGRIQQELSARLAQEPSLRGGAIRVQVEGGMVLLHGSVNGIGAWQCAITNAQLVQGVQSVVDYLVIERGERDVSCLAPRSESSIIVGEP